TPINWHTHLTPTGTPTPPLPTYAFHHKRYWLDADTSTGRAPTPAGHPLLGTPIRVAGTDTTLFATQISARTHPHLVHHTPAGTPHLPASALVELAVHAGSQAGCPVLDRLTLANPLTLAPHTTLHLQTRLAAGDNSGRRTVTVFAFRDGDGDDAWIEVAEGLLRADTDGGAPTDRFSGPGDEFEVRLSEEAWGEAGQYGLHPSLLEAVVTSRPGSAPEGSTSVAAEWSGVRVYAAGASAVRAVLTERGDGTVSVRLTDENGLPVATVDSLGYRTTVDERFAFAQDGGYGEPARQAAQVSAGVQEPLARRLAKLPEADRHEAVLSEVSAAVAAVLGHADAGDIDLEASFHELGFDSMTAVELRNRLSTITGSPLPATLVFDHPTPTALAGQLLARLAVGFANDADGGDTTLGELDRLEAELVSASRDERQRVTIAARLQTLLSRLDEGPVAAPARDVASEIAAASEDEIFDFIDKQLGRKTD
ncbi:phosphopantetheine-binding protein, partial [Streptomyces violascens]|uniref:phosphopantetheine-binding protein n=1 Tax=Streptomyces violascens TaxID=67381 RepID=UPI00365BBAAA